MHTDRSREHWAGERSHHCASGGQHLFPIPGPRGAAKCEKASESESLMIAFSAHGEVALGDGMAAYLTKFHAQPISTLARWIVDRKVIHFYRLESLMIPTFQFQPGSGQVRISVI